MLPHSQPMTFTVLEDMWSAMPWGIWYLILDSCLINGLIMLSITPAGPQQPTGLCLIWVREAKKEYLMFHRSAWPRPRDPLEPSAQWFQSLCCLFSLIWILWALVCYYVPIRRSDICIHIGSTRLILSFKSLYLALRQADGWRPKRMHIFILHPICGRMNQWMQCWADGHCMDAGNVSHDLMLHECGQT